MEHKYSLDLFNISKYRDEIYGISMIWIMLFHAEAILDLQYPPLLASFIHFGNMGCEIFLLCSGISLYFSFAKSKDLGMYLRNRLLRLLVPIYITNVAYWFFTFWIKGNSPIRFFSKMTALDFWISGDQQIWFLSFILIAYLIYPYIYAILFGNSKGNPHIRVILLIGLFVLCTFAIREIYPDFYKKTEIALTRFPIFIFGCYMGKFVYEKKKLPVWLYAVVFAAIAGVWFVLLQKILSDIYRRYIYFPSGIAVLILMALVFSLIKWKPFHSILKFFGKISINLYLSHILIIRLYRTTHYADHSNFKEYAILMIASIIMGFVTYKISNLVLKLKIFKKA